MSVQPSAIIAKPITGSSIAPLMLRYSTAKWARSVIVINANATRLFDFLHRIEGGFAGHLADLLNRMNREGRDRVRLPIPPFAS